MDRYAIRWLAAIVGILGTVAVVDGLMITEAVRHGGGEVEPDAYARALEWDKTRAERSSSERVGWQVSGQLVPGGSSADELRIEVRDRDRRPVPLVHGVAVLSRPSDSRLTRRVPLDDAGDGSYRAAIAPLETGLWQVDLALEGRVDRVRTSIRIER